MDNKYDVWTTSYFPHNRLGQQINNSVTFISIQTWHRRLSHLGDQNRLGSLKVVDSIDIKWAIPVEIFGDHMKKKQ